MPKELELEGKERIYRRRETPISRENRVAFINATGTPRAEDACARRNGTRLESPRARGETRDGSNLTIEPREGTYDVCSMNAHLTRRILPGIGRAGDPCGIWSRGFRAGREKSLGAFRSPWCVRAEAIDRGTDRSEDRVRARREKDSVRRASISDVTSNVEARRMGRRFFVGGNWKMNGTKSEIGDIVAFLKTGPLDPDVGTYARNVVSRGTTGRVRQVIVYYQS